MRGVLGVVTCFTLFLASVAAQSTQTLTRPQLPDPAALARVGLKQRWFTYVPMDGRRDGIAYAQVFDGQVLVQTTSGGVACLDAETGATQWRLRLGDPYQSLRQPVAANRNVFLILAGLKVYGVARKTGIVEFEYQAPDVLSGAPGIDESYGFVCRADGRVNAYSLPTADASGADRGGQSTVGGVDAYGKALDTTRVTPLWSIQINSVVNQPPAIFADHVVFVNREGTLQTFLKSRNIPVDKFQTNVGVSAPLAQQGKWLYVASEDFNLYAFEVEQGLLNLRWQRALPSAIVQKPWVIGDEVYAFGRNGGMVCMDRFTGAPKWWQRVGNRFVACTRRLAIVADQRGQLHCMDRQRGTVLGTWDASAYTVRVSNDVSDRIYLANNDGLVVCLQDADKSHDQPVLHNAPPPAAKKPNGAEGSGGEE